MDSNTGNASIVVYSEAPLYLIDRSLLPREDALYLGYHGGDT